MSGAVETFRQISWLIFKWVLIVCGGLIGLATAVWLAVLGYNWYTYDRHVENVAFIISTDRKDCADDNWPIHLIIGNDSGRTMERVTFSFTARYPDRSSDLASPDNSYLDDHILGPKEGWGACYALPTLTQKIDDPRKLDWSIRSKSIKFR